MWLQLCYVSCCTCIWYAQHRSYFETIMIRTSTPVCPAVLGSIIVLYICQFGFVHPRKLQHSIIFLVNYEAIIIIKNDEHGSVFSQSMLHVMENKKSLSVDCTSSIWQKFPAKKTHKPPHHSNENTQKLQEKVADIAKQHAIRSFSTPSRL